MYVYKNKYKYYSLFLFGRPLCDDTQKTTRRTLEATMTISLFFGRAGRRERDRGTNLCARRKEWANGMFGAGQGGGRS